MRLGPLRAHAGVTQVRHLLRLVSLLVQGLTRAMELYRPSELHEFAALPHVARLQAPENHRLEEQGQPSEAVIHPEPDSGDPQAVPEGCCDNRALLDIFKQRGPLEEADGAALAVEVLTHGAMYCSWVEPLDFFAHLETDQANGLASLLRDVGRHPPKRLGPGWVRPDHWHPLIIFRQEGDNTLIIWARVLDYEREHLGDFRHGYFLLAASERTMSATISCNAGL